MKVEQKDREIEQSRQIEVEESDAYSLFVYAVRSQVTRDYYLRRLRIFLNYISLLPEGTMEERCNLFASKGKKDPSGVFSCIVRFLQYQRERVEREEITGATLRNFVKAIKLFCEMSDIPVSWKKISRGLPKTRRFADDRAPTIEEIQKISEYPDRRIKGIVYTMASSGIRLGAWDYICWKHIEPIKRDGKVVAAKIVVYPGDDEEYFSFITPEAYYQLEGWIECRRESGEKIDGNSWLMRQLWNTKEGQYHHGTIKDAVKLKSSGVKRLIEDALWTQGIRKKTDLKRNRYEFQTDHGFRKWFKTRCEISGMKSINIEKLMGHSIGISDSYYRATENELLDFRKLMLIYKLVHFEDCIVDLDIGIKSRNRELCKPYLRLFYGTDAQAEIEHTFQTFIDSKNAKKGRSIEAILVPVIINLVEDKGVQVTTNDTWEFIKSNVEGESYGSEEYRTSDFTLYRNTITKTLEDKFGAEYKHTNKGGSLKFKLDKLQRLYGSYNADIKIKSKLKSDSSDSSDGIKSRATTLEGPKPQETTEKSQDSNADNVNISQNHVSKVFLQAPQSLSQDPSLPSLPSPIESPNGEDKDKAAMLKQYDRLSSLARKKSRAAMQVGADNNDLS